MKTLRALEMGKFDRWLRNTRADPVYPCQKKFEPTAYQMLVVYLLFTTTALSINAFGNRFLPLFTKSACLHPLASVRY